MEWISVKDRLPVLLGDEVLAYSESRGVHTTQYDLEGFGYFMNDIETDVTHWMPLPEPPKDEEERLKQEMYEREASGYTQKD